MEYRYDHFRRELLMDDMAWRGGVPPSEEMPDFDLHTTKGEHTHQGDRYPQPETMAQKLELARELEQRDELPWPVAVDGIMDADGRVAFRALWSNDREGVLRKALADVAAGRSPAKERSGRVVPMMRGIAHMDEMLGLSGPTARRDVRREAPPVYAMAKVAAVMRRRSRTAA